MSREQGLRAWAAALAAELPPLTSSPGSLRGSTPATVRSQRRNALPALVASLSFLVPAAPGRRSPPPRGRVPQAADLTSEKSQVTTSLW